MNYGKRTGLLGGKPWKIEPLNEKVKITQENMRSSYSLRSWDLCVRLCSISGIWKYCGYWSVPILIKSCQANPAWVVRWRDIYRYAWFKTRVMLQLQLAGSAVQLLRRVCQFLSHLLTISWNGEVMGRNCVGKRGCFGGWGGGQGL